MIYIILGYLLFVGLFAIFSYFALYHIYRFGFVGDATIMVIRGYIGLSALIILVTLVAILIV